MSGGEVALSTSPPDPGDLVARIAAGDRAAEAHFIATYLRGVRALVRRRCRPNDPSVEDLVQDVLSRVLERLRAGAIRDAAALPAYVQAAIAYATNAEYRTRRPAEGIEAIADLPASDNPAEQLDSSRRAAILRNLLALLPVPRDREILVRFYLEEQDKDEVCRSLGIETSHFHRVVFRARERLRQLLDGTDIGEV